MVANQSIIKLLVTPDHGKPWSKHLLMWLDDNEMAISGCKFKHAPVMPLNK